MSWILSCLIENYHYVFLPLQSTVHHFQNTLTNSNWYLVRVGILC